MASSSTNRLWDHLRCGLAVVCAAWVVILGLAAVSPDLHEGLHHRNAAAVQDQCAVELLAHGALVATPVMVPVPSVVGHPELGAASPVELFLDSPRYLLQPERGPPEA